MNRPAGVTISAVFLILGSVLTALVGGVMFLAHSLAPPTTPQPPFANFIMYATSALFFGCAVWGAFTVAGLFRMRRWARISILIIGALAAIFCGLSLAMLYFVAQQVPQFEFRGRAGMILGIVTVLYSLPILVGLWWLIYFNSAPVKAAFLEGYVPPRGPQRPLSIAVIAWHFVVFGMLTPVALWYHLPAFLFGLLLTGWTAALIYCSLAVIELWIGIELLRLKARALTAAACFLVFGMVHSVVVAFIPDSAAKISAAMRSLSPEVASQAGAITPPSPILNALLGVLLMALPLYYLVTRREAFLAVSRAKSEIPL